MWRLKRGATEKSSDRPNNPPPTPPPGRPGGRGGIDLGSLQQVTKSHKGLLGIESLASPGEGGEPPERVPKAEYIFHNGLLTKVEKKG